MRRILLAIAMVIFAQVMAASALTAPNGLQITEGINEVVTVWQTAVVGEVEVDEGAASGTLTFTFVGPDSLPITPLPSDSISVIISDLSQVEYTSLTPFTGTLASIDEHGEISMQVEYWEGATLVYTSPTIPLHIHGAHAEAEGLRLVISGDTAVWVDGLTVTGEIESIEGEPTATIDVWFVDDLGELFQPDVNDGFSVKIVTGDTTIAQSTVTGDWSFIYTGVEGGETFCNIEIQHEGHADYTSSAIDVHVHHAHAEPEGLVVKRDGMPIATIWEGVVHGSVRASLGETDSLEVFFLDMDSVEFQPDETDFALVASSFEILIATVDTVPGQRYWFSASGLAVDTTDLQLGLWHVDHIDYSAPVIALVVTCCVGTRGNVNLLGPIDLSDLSLLISYLTMTPRPVLPCADAANVNASPLVAPDLSDLSTLIAYLTVTPRPVLPSCL